MKKIITLYIISFFFSCTIRAQFHDNTSIFGNKGASNDFLLGLPDDSLDHIVLTYNEGNVKIEVIKYKGIELIWHTNTPYSDKNGKFGFFSDGIHVWNKNYKKEAINFENVTPNDYRFNQFNLALPIPNNEKKVKLIYGIGSIIIVEKDSVGNPIDSGYLISNNLYHTEIDIEKDSGFVGKEYEIITDSLATGRFTATRHGNGRDWWILVSRAGFSNTYHTLLLDDKGLHYIKKQSVGKVIEDGVGAAHFSPDGKYYIRFEEVDFVKPSVINIYSFDRCSGILSNPKQLRIYPSIYGGISISPNSRYLYFSNFNKVHQYDLFAKDIEKSVKTIAYLDTINKTILGSYANFYRMQLMPDRRIYCTSAFFGSEYFHIIEKPDLPYPYCNFRQRAISFSARNFGSVPNFPNYRLGPLDGSPCDTLGINNEPRAWYRYEKDTTNKLKVEFTDLSFYEPKEWLWDFGDGSPMSKDTLPVHIFPKNGTYNVCLTVKNKYGSHTHCKNINFGTTATQDFEFQDQIQVAPNPFGSVLYVTLSSLVANPVLHLYDSIGREVLSSSLYFGVTDLRTEHIPAGLYLWNVTSRSDIIGAGKVMKVE